MDRDGTLIHDAEYLADERGVRLYKSTLPAFEIFKKKGYMVFVVSNQSGVGRGYFDEACVGRVNARMEELLLPYKINEITYCPHAPEDKCKCRKPLPAMGLKLIKKYNIDPARSYMVGDKKSDIDFGRNLGMKTILVRTANGAGEVKKYGAELGAGKVARNILAAAKYMAVFAVVFVVAACGRSSAAAAGPTPGVINTQEVLVDRPAPQAQVPPQAAAAVAVKPEEQQEKPKERAPEQNLKSYELNGRQMHPYMALPVESALTAPNPPLWATEELEYSVNYSFIRAGTAYIRTKGLINTPAGAAYVVETVAESASVIDAFFKVRDFNYSFLNAKDYTSLGYTQSIREGNYIRDEWLTFDVKNKKFTGLMRKKDGVDQYLEGEIPGPVSDMLSSLYYLRQQDLTSGKDIIFDVTNREVTYPMLAKIIKRETIKTGAGKFNCVVVEPMFRGEGIFIQKGKSLKVWLTDDDYKLPVKMEAKVFIGSVNAQLESYKIN